MKPISLLWTLAFMCVFTYSFAQPAACDTSIAGIRLNMSLSANCQLNVNNAMANLLMANHSSSITYDITVLDGENSPMPMPLTEEHIGMTFKVRIVAGGCNTSNVGWSYLTLEDKTPPVIACNNDTLSCIEFRSYPHPPVDDCDLDTVYILSQLFEPACDLPYQDSISTRVMRTYVAIDGSGNADTCSEEILIRRLKRSDIQFPPDLYDISCDTLAAVTDASGNLLPPPNNLTTGTGTQMDKYIFGVPTGSGAGTGSGTSFYGNNFKECRVRAYYRDIYKGSNGCNTTFQRLWTVYEWYCNNEEVEYKHLQTITFKDTTPPSFVFSVDTMFIDLDPNTCSVSIPYSSIGIDSLFDNCTAVSDLQRKYEYFPHILGSINDSTIILNGVDTVSVALTVKDNCGNSTTKEMTLISRDISPPVAICKGAINVSLSDPDSTSVPVDTFNVKSYDPCATIELSGRKMEETIYQSEFITFSCSDPDTIMVLLRATDPAGNSDVCMTIVTLKKDQVACPPANSFDITQISGSVRYINEAPVSDIQIKLSGNLSGVTDQQGKYSFTAEAGGQLSTLMPEKNDHPEAGLSTLDVIYLQRHMMGIQDLDNAYQVIAADIDANDEINAADLLELRRMVLGDIVDFSKNKSYVFIPDDIQFIDDMDPWANGPELFGKSIRMSAGQYEQDFTAIKVGDVNNSLHSAKIRSEGTATFVYDMIPMGRFVELNIYTDQDITLEGLQTTLKFDDEALKLMKIGKAQLDIDPSNYSLNFASEGYIPFSWNSLLPHQLDKSKPLFRITFEKLYETTPVFSFSHDKITSEAYIDDKTLSAILMTKADNSPEEFTIGQNIPNPWENETTIEFAIPQKSTVKLNIYDASMRKLYKDENHFGAGKNVFRISYQDLPETGVFFYEIIFQDQVRVSKMTKL